MPFPNQTPLDFTRMVIEQLPREQMGCYGIAAETSWIYIGASLDIRESLLGHVNGNNPCIAAHEPTRFVIARAASQAQMDTLARLLLLEFQPHCNDQDI